MKKLALFIITLLISVVAATAVVNDKGLLMQRIREPYTASAGDTLFFSVHTAGEKAQDNVKVRAYILDLGLIGADGPFDVGTSGNNAHLMIDLPEETNSGCYLVRLSASNDDTRRTRHRWVCVN